MKLIKDSTMYAFDTKTGELRNAFKGINISVPENGLVMVMDGKKLKEFKIEYDQSKERYTLKENPIVINYKL